MTPVAVRLACGLVRGWTRVYTAGLPRPLREARRAEIESDLWEGCHDQAAPPGGAIAAQILARLVLGLHDDLHWRATQGGASRAIVVGTAVGALIVGASWVYSQYLTTQMLPSPPPRPMKFVSGAAAGAWGQLG